MYLSLNSYVLPLLIPSTQLVFFSFDQIAKGYPGIKYPVKNHLEQFHDEISSQDI